MNNLLNKIFASHGFSISSIYLIISVITLIFPHICFGYLIAWNEYSYFLEYETRVAGDHRNAEGEIMNYGNATGEFYQKEYEWNIYETKNAFHYKSDYEYIAFGGIEGFSEDGWGIYYKRYFTVEKSDPNELNVAHLCMTSKFSNEIIYYPEGGGEGAIFYYNAFVPNTGLQLLEYSWTTEAKPSYDYDYTYVAVGQQYALELYINSSPIAYWDEDIARSTSITSELTLLLQTPNAVPEPDTIVLLGSGLIFSLLCFRKSRLKIRQRNGLAGW